MLDAEDPQMNSIGETATLLKNVDLANTGALGWTAGLWSRFGLV
jgi:hypothetical protein